jgi:predicted deacetylase
MKRARLLAVALHDVEPASFARCVEIRGWLAARGVERVTLLVIPAPDLHPVSRHRQLIEWLTAGVEGGDAIAQHGLHHAQVRRPKLPRRVLARWQGGAAAEYPGLSPDDTGRSVAAGRRILKLAGLDPSGFVAPGYAYTGALRRELARNFRWWARLWTLERRDGWSLRAPAVSLGSSSPSKRALSPAAARLGGLLSGRILRLDIHPADFNRDRHVRTLEAILARADERTAVTYDELLAG